LQSLCQGHPKLREVPAHAGGGAGVLGRFDKKIRALWITVGTLIEICWQADNSQAPASMQNKGYGHVDESELSHSRKYSTRVSERSSKSTRGPFVSRAGQMRKGSVSQSPSLSCEGAATGSGPPPGRREKRAPQDESSEDEDGGMNASAHHAKHPKSQVDVSIHRVAKEPCIRRSECLDRVVKTPSSAAKSVSDSFFEDWTCTK